MAASYRQMLRKFLSAKKAANRSAITIDWYERMIDSFIEWTRTHGGTSVDLAALIDGYLESERQRGMKPATVSARYRALSAWLNWCAKRKLISHSPIPELDAPNVPRTHVAYVTLDQYHELMDSLTGREWTDKRDRLIITLLYWSGLRAQELVDLNTNDVNPRERMVLVRQGKGGKARVVPTAPDIADVLHEYLRRRPQWDGPELFLSQWGNGKVRGAMTRDGLRQVIERICRKAKMPHLHAHLWRHGFAMWTLNAGVDLSAVSAMMGHSSTAVTQAVYASWQARGLSRVYGEAMQHMTTGDLRSSGVARTHVQKKAVTPRDS